MLKFMKSYKHDIKQIITDCRNVFHKM